MALQQVQHYGERRPRLAPAARRKRVRVWIVVGIFMGFVAVAWAWAFQRAPSAAAGTSGVPLLAADPQPTRQKPADPGGMKVADIDPLAYDSARSPPRVEDLLPSPEKALPQPAPDSRPAAIAPPPAAVAPPPSAPSPAADDGGAQNQVADQTVADQQVADQTVGSPVKLVPDEPAAAPAPVAKPKPAAKAAPAPRPPAAKPVLKSRAKPGSVRDATSPRAEAMAAPPAGGKGYRLQLASLRSAADARAVAEKLRRAYGDVLGATGFSVVAADLGARGTYYRVMTGAMSPAAASQLCDRLRQRGAACLLAKH